MRGLPRSKALGIAAFGADGDDGLLERDELLALVGLDAQGARILEVAAPVHDLDAAHFRQLGDAAAKAARGWNSSRRAAWPHRWSAAAKVMPRCSDSRAAATVWAAYRSALEGMQPRFRQTPPRTFVPLDQDDFLAEVGGVKSRGVAARAGADHHDFGLMGPS